MLTEDGESTAFGLSFRQHDNRQMQHILRAYDRLPPNPTVRSAVYLNLVFLEKTLDQDTIAQIKQVIIRTPNFMLFVSSQLWISYILYFYTLSMEPS